MLHVVCFSLPLSPKLCNPIAEIFLAQRALHGAETPNPSLTYSPLICSIHKLLDLLSRRNARRYAHPSLTQCAARGFLRLFLVIYIFGGGGSTKVIHFLVGLNDCFTMPTSMEDASENRKFPTFTPRSPHFASITFKNFSVSFLRACRGAFSWVSTFNPLRSCSFSL